MMSKISVFLEEAGYEFGEVVELSGLAEEIPIIPENESRFEPEAPYRRGRYRKPLKQQEE